MSGMPDMPPPPGGGGGTPIPTRGFGDLLGAAFEQYKDNIAKLAPIVAVVVVPLTLIGAIIANAVKPEDVVGITYDANGVATSVSVNDSFIATLIGGVVVGAAIAVVTAALLQAVILRASAQAVVGDPVDVGASYKWGLKKIGPVIWISILVGLIVAGGLILFIIPGIIFMVLLAVAIPALVVENQRGTGALSRSWNLVKGDWWRVLGIIVVTGFITNIVSSIIGAIGGNSLIGMWITDAIAQIITGPFTALVSILLYLDLRARKEGLTVEALRANIAST
jgi:hypothetical protein